MIMLLSGTSTGRPSISSFAMCVTSVLSLGEALAVADVVFELCTEMLDKALHWQRRGVTQRADGATGDVVRHRVQLVQILRTVLTILDAVNHAVKPAGALAARRPLAAKFLEVKIRKPLQPAHDASRFI